MKTVGKKGSNQYTLREIIGEGSFGKVYHSPPYAIKQMTLNLPPYLKNALQNQISILKAFKHPNIVQLYDVVYEENYVYLVMEYCQSDLAKYLKKMKIDEKMAIDIFKQILAGFRELVTKGIIHRDLKPANILVTVKGEFKLADFGFAKFVDHYESNMLQSCVGTPLYMAPQILKRGKYSTKCDIWSIGCIFYQLVAGSIPWTGYSESNLLENISRRPLVIPEGLSDWTRKVLKKMLVVNENDRISWEQLFKYVFGSEHRARSNSRNQKKENQRANTPKKQTAVKSEKVLPKNQTAVKSEKVLPKNQTKQTLACGEQNLIDLFILELRDFFDKEKAKKIAQGKKYVILETDQDKITEVLQLFTEEVQLFYKKNLVFPH